MIHIDRHAMHGLMQGKIHLLTGMSEVAFVSHTSHTSVLVLFIQVKAQIDWKSGHILERENAPNRGRSVTAS
jgi:hypothetical protein